MDQIVIIIIIIIIKPLQNKKGQNNVGYLRKKQFFPYKRAAFFSGTPNFFGPSYFEAALVVCNTKNAPSKLVSTQCANKLPTESL